MMNKQLLTETMVPIRKKNYPVKARQTQLKQLVKDKQQTLLFDNIKLFQRVDRKW